MASRISRISMISGNEISKATPLGLLCCKLWTAVASTCKKAPLRTPLRFYTPAVLPCTVVADLVDVALAVEAQVAPGRVFIARKNALRPLFALLTHVRALF